MSSHTIQATRPSICEISVASSDRKGARALACLLADVGQRQGLLPLSIHSRERENPGRVPAGGEQVVIRFAAHSGRPLRILAILDEEPSAPGGGELILTNSREAARSAQSRNVDASAIAGRLGIPAYLPMVGAVARMAGWSDLEQVKSAVRLALTESAPHWLAPGLDAVEAGYHALA